MPFLTWCQNLCRAGDDAEAYGEINLADGGAKFYVAKPKAEVPHVDQVASSGQPLVETIEMLREQTAGDAIVQASLRNKVKICPNPSGGCGKACATTLVSCNACGASLADVAISFNDNVFMGFIYGVGKGKFPYTISMRQQTQEFLCFDDPLSMSPCHLNAIPTNVYVPDLRYLFADPERGLRLMESLFDIAAATAIQQFWGNAAFKQYFFQGQAVPSKEQLRDVVLAGVNYPPSMYQLHLQFIHPPLLPFHAAQAMDNQHFHYRRFFPFEYVCAALKLGNAVKTNINDSFDIEVIISKCDALGVSYDKIHKEFLSRFRMVQQRFARWSPRDFEFAVINGEVHTADSRQPCLGEDAKAIQAADAKALQNYGRPYNYETGKPSGSHYEFAKRPGEVAVWPCVGS